MLKKFIFGLGFLVSTSVCLADSLSWGAFADVYYLYDSNLRRQGDRPYMTTGARANEFNVNLAYVEVTAEKDRARGRIALQAGTSVQANYLNEPAVGTISGPSLVRHVQEARVGYRLAEKTWIDAGIYPSHIGFESFISRDNWTYTRTMAGEFSPFFQSGVRLSHEAEAFTLQFHVVNGWADLSENNSNKSIGTQVSVRPNDRVTLSYNTFFGEETGAQWRFFQDFYATVVLTDFWVAAGVADFGLQRVDGGSDTSNWYGAAFINRFSLSDNLFIGARMEYYTDPSRVIASPVNGAKFTTYGASVNLDVGLTKGLWWRTEVRGFWAKEPVFHTKDGGFVTSDYITSTSLCYTFES